MWLPHQGSQSATCDLRSSLVLTATIREHLSRASQILLKATYSNYIIYSSQPV